MRRARKLVRIQLVAVICALCVGSGQGQAEPGSAPDGVKQSPVDIPRGGAIKIRWPDIVKLVDRHPRVAESKQRAAAAHAAVDAAGAVPNPSLEAAVAHGESIDGTASALEWGLALSIPFGWVAQRGVKVEVASAEARTVDAESQALRRRVLLQLRILFWNLLYAQEQVAALKELHNQTEQLVRSVQRRAERGDVRPVEATRIEIEAEKLAGELDRATSLLSARREQLSRWLGLSRGEELVAEADLSRLPEPMDLQSATVRMRKSHPSIRAGRARIQALEQRTRAERWARLPSFSVEAFADSELDRRAYGVGLSLELPLWNWNSGGVQQAESTLTAGRRRLEAEQLELEDAAFATAAACRAGVAISSRYKERVLPRAEAVARTIERTYQLGEAALLEVIDARRNLLETRRQYLAALFQAQTECSRLESLAGEEMK